MLNIQTDSKQWLLAGTLYCLSPTCQNVNVFTQYKTLSTFLSIPERFEGLAYVSFTYFYWLITEWLYLRGLIGQRLHEWAISLSIALVLHSLLPQCLFYFPRVKGIYLAFVADARLCRHLPAVRAGQVCLITLQVFREVWHNYLFQLSDLGFFQCFHE